MITECKRCGICCQKGGPALHIQDLPLIEEGIIALKYLYTIREGETVWDNIRECFMSADSDIIKIKSIKNFRTCVFFDSENYACAIYENRPVECRALKCWDTSEIETLYAYNRLTRKDIVQRVDGLWELIKEHQARCDYAKIEQMSKMAYGNDMLAEIIIYDTNIRAMAVEKGGIDPEINEFLFGRELSLNSVSSRNIRKLRR